MDKVPSAGVGFGLRIGPQQARREKGKLNAGNQRVLLIFLGWSVRCVRSAEVAKTNFCSHIGSIESIRSVRSSYSK